MITSKLTSKAQTTIPQPIRAALNIAEGDELAYEIRGAEVILRCAFCFLFVGTPSGRFRGVF